MSIYDCRILNFLGIEASASQKYTSMSINANIRNIWEITCTSLLNHAGTDSIGYKTTGRDIFILPPGIIVTWNEMEAVFLSFAW